jgi:hypothetical protein
MNAGWSVRELKRQIETSLYERLLLSSGAENKERVLELALNGNEITKPIDIIFQESIRFRADKKSSPKQNSNCSECDSFRLYQLATGRSVRIWG